MPKMPFPKINLRIIRNILLIVILVVVSFSSGYTTGYKGFTASLKEFPKVAIDRGVPQEKDELNFDLFWQVWDTLQLKYFDSTKLIPSEMVYGAIRGMVAAVGDPYTSFIPPREYKVVQEDLNGSFEGVGIQIGYKGTQLAVIAPLPNSPAEEAGIKAGDLIIGIKDDRKGIDRGTVGINLTEAVQIIRGPANTPVTLTLLREGEEDLIVTEVVRKSIDVPSVTLSYEGDNGSVAHIKVLKFSGETIAEWEKFVPEILSKPNLKGIIVDVRNNPGGYLQGAIDLASDFLETGEVMVIEEMGGSKEESEYRVEKLGRFRKIKMAVLVNEGSASASEIFAGAIKDNKRGDIVGSVTFGKGTIQEPQEVEGGAGLHITIARWLTPNGTWVNDGGLKPDVEIEDNEETEEDEQLQEALRLF
jgi:carboxyl-terminal processing protease